MLEKECSIPDLFPGRLLDICEERVLSMLMRAGRRVGQHRQSDSRKSYFSDYEMMSQGSNLSTSIISRAWPDWFSYPAKSNYTSSQFLEHAQICREFLSNLLATPVLDSLSQQAGKNLDPECIENIFTFTVLCGDRLGHLTVHQHTELENQKSRNWAKYISSPEGSPLILSCLAQLSSLSTLCIHYVATNDMLYVISTVCSRLVTLDISYSHEVTDIGLVHLCGVLKGSQGCVNMGPRGCKYLRELYFNPQSHSKQEQIMPRVTACLLRHLPLLQVLDLPNLHSGIDHYYRGTRESTQRQSRVKPLNLVHYTGSDRLADVMDICPKLRTFKLFVTEQLPQLGSILQGLNHCLSQVTLVYGNSRAEEPTEPVFNHEDQEEPAPSLLFGFQEFLAACGNKISRLEIDSTQDSIIRKADLISVATHCTQLEYLGFTNFHVDVEVPSRFSDPPVSRKPPIFPFLTHVRFSNVSIEENGKDIFRYLLGGALELEHIYISFLNPGYFFSDFLLDDILRVNELAHLQKFILRGGALTLISALRLISTRPKLRTLGELLHWDVEPSELETFIQILRRARSLNLLQDIHIF